MNWPTKGTKATKEKMKNGAGRDTGVSPVLAA
jgi:hypothetical protein